MARPLRREVADTATGEVILTEKEKRVPYGHVKDPDTGKRHMVTGALAAKELRTADYSAATFRVLWHLIYITDETRLIDQTQEEIAEETDLGQASVSRALRQLIEGGHVERRGRRLYLNPFTGFTGTGFQHQQAIARTPVELHPRATVHHLKPVS